MKPNGSTPGASDAPADLDQRLDAARGHVEALLPGARAVEGPQPVFLLPAVGGIRERFLELQRRLAPLGLLPLLRRQGDQTALILVPKPPPGQWKWQVNALLFLATVATTFLSGLQTAEGLRGLCQELQAQIRLDCAITPIGGGLTFSAALLLILLAHEMGHKLVAVRRGIDASLPYFIPMVPLAPLPGTMGAVIVTRTPAPNRDSLMDLGASGPIAGFLVAIPVLIYGVLRSPVVPEELVRRFALTNYPDPLLIRWMIQVLLNPPPGSVVLGHPVLFAGWFGLVVTSINLLPAGMLDGGHAVRAVFDARVHRVLSYVGAALAALIGAYPMAILILLLTRRGHPGPLDDLSPLSPSRRLVGILLIAIFALSVVSLTIPLFR